MSRRTKNLKNLLKFRKKTELNEEYIEMEAGGVKTKWVWKPKFMRLDRTPQVFMLSMNMVILKCGKCGGWVNQKSDHTDELCNTSLAKDVVEA
jgi:hypothetical protein